MLGKISNIAPTTRIILSIIETFLNKKPYKAIPYAAKATATKKSAIRNEDKLASTSRRAGQYIKYKGRIKAGNPRRTVVIAAGQKPHCAIPHATMGLIANGGVIADRVEIKNTNIWALNSDAPASTSAGAPSKATRI